MVSLQQDVSRQDVLDGRSQRLSPTQCTVEEAIRRIQALFRAAVRAPAVEQFPAQRVQIPCCVPLIDLIQPLVRHQLLRRHEAVAHFLVFRQHAAVSGRRGPQVQVGVGLPLHRHRPAARRQRHCVAVLRVVQQRFELLHRLAVLLFLQGAFLSVGQRFRCRRLARFRHAVHAAVQQRVDIACKALLQVVVHGIAGVGIVDRLQLIPGHAAVSRDGQVVRTQPVLHIRAGQFLVAHHLVQQFVPGQIAVFPAVSGAGVDQFFDGLFFPNLLIISSQLIRQILVRPPARVVGLRVPVALVAVHVGKGRLVNNGLTDRILVKLVVALRRVEARVRQRLDFLCGYPAAIGLALTVLLIQLCRFRVLHHVDALCIRHPLILPRGYIAVHHLLVHSIPELPSRLFILLFDCHSSLLTYRLQPSCVSTSPHTCSASAHPT